MKKEWTWNASYQRLFDKAKLIIKEDACLKFCKEMKCLYLEISVVGCRATLLQIGVGTSCPRDETPGNNMLRPIAFMSKSFSAAERRYINLEEEALAILHHFEKFYHYCFAKEVGIIKDHKPLVAFFKNDVATLPQRLHSILPTSYQHRASIMYNPQPSLFIAD